MGSRLLITGLILLILFGGILPLMVNSLEIDNTNEYGFVLTTATDFVKNGIDLKIPRILTLGFSKSFNINLFQYFPSFQSLTLNYLNGISLIPLSIGLPLMVLIFTLLLVGTIKIFIP